MAGERYIGTDDSGRPRYKDAKGRMLPPSFRPAKRKSPSSRVTDRVSERSRNVITDALSGFGDDVMGAARRRNNSMNRAGRAVTGVGGIIRDTSLARDEFMEMNRGTYGEFSQEGRYGGEWQGYRDGLDTIGDPNAPFQVRVAGDAEKILKGMDPAVLARLQDRLVSAGYMPGGAFVPGDPTNPKTLDAFRSLLTQANGKGMIWQEALSDTERVIKETGIGADELDDGPAPFVAPTYTAPDYATLAQTVKDQMRDALGRDPDEDEMALLTAELSGWDREAYESDVAGQRAQYDAQVAAGENGTEGLGGDTVQGVDPVARFRESFESKFQGELRGIERTEEAGETGEMVRGATSTLSRMSGGMG